MIPCCFFVLENYHGKLSPAVLGDFSALRSGSLKRKEKSGEAMARISLLADLE